MSKWIDCKIYTIDELKNTEFSEDDLHNLFDTKSLNLSLILHMFKLINDKRKDWEIIKMVRTESGWPDKYSMPRKLYNNFVKDLKERIYESQKDDNNKEDIVFVVNDVNGEFVGVYDLKDDAETAKKEYEITPDMKAEIKEVPRSKYVKD